MTAAFTKSRDGDSVTVKTVMMDGKRRESDGVQKRKGERELEAW